MTTPERKIGSHGAWNCPWCGRHMLADRFATEEYFMACDCGACGPTCATQQEAVDRWNEIAAPRAEIEKAAYKRGWSDREDDLIAGVNRIVPPELRGATVTPEQRREIREALAGLRPGTLPKVQMEQALRAAGLLEE